MGDFGERRYKLLERLANGERAKRREGNGSAIVFEKGVYFDDSPNYYTIGDAYFLSKIGFIIPNDVTHARSSWEITTYGRSYVEGNYYGRDIRPSKVENCTCVIQGADGNQQTVERLSDADDGKYQLEDTGRRIMSAVINISQKQSN